jgi:hypothetical protein
MLRPYLLPRFASISIYFPPVIGSAYKSFTPSVLPASFNFFVPKLRWYLNLPHKFYAHVCSNSCRKHIYSINNRLRKTISNTGICSLLFFHLWYHFWFYRLSIRYGVSAKWLFQSYRGYCPLPYWLCPLS